MSEKLFLVFLIQVIYMDHLIFPQAAINEHQLNYSLPRACFVHQTDFDLVLEFDKNKLSLGKASFGKCRVSFVWFYLPHPLHNLFLPIFVFSLFYFCCLCTNGFNSFRFLFTLCHVVSPSIGDTVHNISCRRPGRQQE